jgi:beta-mannosidase
MHRLDLTGSWHLTARAGGRPELPDDIPVKIPGDNLSALYQAGLVDDPYFGTNELDLQWIGTTDWTLERTFEIDADPLLSRPARFRAESIDTVAQVAINGTAVGSTDNMFVPVDLAIPAGVLKHGTNTITVTFSAAERVAHERAARLPYPIPHVQMPVQSQHRNLVRKIQCHGGWDWGPCYMICGLYGYVELVASDEPTLDYAPTMVAKDDDGWSVTVEPWFVLPAADGHPSSRSYAGSIRVSVTDPDGREAAAHAGETVVEHGRGTPVVLRVEQPQLWWPNGFGAQPLYTVTIEAFGSRITRRIGFRTLEVRREPDEYGESFAVVVNDVPIFAKGANWIPQDALPGLASEEQLRWLLESSVDANMNMLRVWGGGTYESHRFYELCDELGILIWHDFMFACAMYPADPAFLASVRSEVAHQVLRLKDHPSIALWCGNNENVGALSWFEETRAHRDRYLIDYDRLNEGAVGDTCRAMDPSRLFWPSSPTDGPGEYSDDWKADEKGDMHYWSVWHGGEPFSSYRSVVPRFCSEFGFQSFPSRAAVRSYARPEHHNVTAPDMEHHQRHPRGNTIIMHTMARYYRFPNGFLEQLYLSQVQQAHAIRTAVEYWRTQRPRSMGALFWQLNDNWPVASWASVEYGGTWKLLQYAARRFFAQVLVAAIPVDASGEALATEEASPAGWDLYVVNDRPGSTTGDLTVRIIGFDGTQLHGQTQNDVTVPGLSSIKMHHLSGAHLPAAARSCFVVADWNDTQGTADSTRCQLFLDAPKRCELAQPTVEARVERNGDRISLTLTTDRPAFDVALDPGVLPGRFTDNMITLLPDEPMTVHWIPVGETTASELREQLTVRTLNSVGRGGTTA